MSQWLLLDYACSCGEVTESLESRALPHKCIECPACGSKAPRAMSAPKMGTVWGYAATRGKNDEAPTPDYLDTERLADDGDYDAFKERQRAFTRDQRRAQVKRALG